MRVLTQEDLTFWHANGYVIVRNAVPQANVDAVVDILWEFMEMDRDDPDSWYRPPHSKYGMVELNRSGMVALYQHQSLWDNRHHPRVYGAFTDIWETDKLWVSIDRVNLNPPARADWDFPGFVHWGHRYFAAAAALWRTRRAGFSRCFRSGGWSAGNSRFPSAV